MITQELVVEKILAYLNHQMTERDFVHWAEDALILLVESDMDIPNEKNIQDALSYIGAGDAPGFPLTWYILSEFLTNLGTKVKVTAEPV